jgi:allophanate hydrolase
VDLVTGDQPIWISLLDAAAQAGYGGPGPLAGLRFAIKDNIDLAGFPTTAADPRRTTPAARSAEAVRRLLEAGAVPVGKTNLDQYATGLVGTRSPYGACHAVGWPEHVSGGSSSGSAVAVAAGLVDFALGTDTAGSGRVPAAFNAIVGIKPTRGLVSTRGVLPACRSLDCVTVFARDVRTARAAYEVMRGYDAEDPFAREIVPAPLPAAPRIGVPTALDGLDPEHEAAWLDTLAQAGRLGQLVPVDVSPLLAAAELLYSGPWLAERMLAFGDSLDEDPAVDPTVRRIVAGAAGLSAVEAFRGFERLAALDRASQQVWDGVDALLLPVTPAHPRIAEVAADPVGANSRLGRFTNMTNLLDLCAIAFPGLPRPDGLPFGVQLLAPAGHDDLVANLAAAWCGEAPVVEPAPSATTLLAVAGAHLSGQPLNADLVDRGARFVRAARMAPGYRMFLVDGPLPRPGVTRVRRSAQTLPGPEVEVWSLPTEALGGFLATVAPPLGIGPVDLDDGSRVLGFLCSADGADPERDITRYGGWRSFRERGRPA